MGQLPINISPKLQKWLVGTLAAATAASFAWTAYTYMVLMQDKQSFSWAYVWQVLLFDLLPVLLFLIAFFTSKPYPRPLNRWFIATLKAIVGITAVQLLQTITSLINTFIYRDDAFMMYSGGDLRAYIYYGVVALVVVVYTVLCVKAKNAK